MSNQCEGKAKSGARCRNRTLHESKRCHFHVNTESGIQLSVHVPVVVPVQVQPAKKPVKKRVPKSKPVLPEQCSGKTECCVCLEEMPESDKLDCSHSVCRGCVKNLRNDKCPMCRRDISAKHIKPRDKTKMRQRFQDDMLARRLAAVQAYQQNLV
jgi:hypothetical protein